MASRRDPTIPNFPSNGVWRSGAGGILGVNALGLPDRAAGRREQTPMLVSRSTEESHLYMHLHPCECGEAEFEWQEHGLRQCDRGLLSTYSGPCGKCGRRREFEFALVPEPSPPPPALGGAAPSQIIDPGEFLHTSRAVAATVPADPRELDDDAFHGAYDALAFPIASLDEVLKFIPAGAPAVPVGAFRSPLGRQLRDAEPDLFTLHRLVAAREAYQRLLVEYDAAIHL
jgi:hypothetical protein